MAVAFIALALIGFVLLSKETDDKRVTVAACPTFHDLSYGPSVDLIRTASTAESLKLLETKKTDLVVSGRALKVGEPDLLFKVIGPGYDMIFIEEAVIWEWEIPHIRFYTNLDPDEVKRDLGVVELVAVDDIEEYLDKGPVITRLDGRMKGNVVNLFKGDGTRVEMSRMPRLYGLDTEKMGRFIADF